MWICINPKKCRRFTTKGVNLTFSTPAVMVPPGLENEFMMRIHTAIAEGKLIKFDNAGSRELVVDQQAAVSVIKEEAVDNKVDFQTVRDKNNRVIKNIITMPDENGEYKEAEKKESGIILTDASWSAIDGN